MRVLLILIGLLVSQTLVAQVRIIASQIPLPLVNMAGINVGFETPMGIGARNSLGLQGSYGFLGIEINETKRHYLNVGIRTWGTSTNSAAYLGKKGWDIDVVLDQRTENIDEVLSFQYLQFTYNGWWEYANISFGKSIGVNYYGDQKVARVFTKPSNQVDAFVVNRRWPINLEFGGLVSMLLHTNEKWVNIGYELCIGAFIELPEPYLVKHSVIKSNAPAPETFQVWDGPSLRFQFSLQSWGMITVVTRCVGKKNE